MAPWLARLPQNAVGVDLSIADKAALSKGLGSAVLLAFIQKLRREGLTDIIIDPDQDNKRAIRAYEKAGFRAIPDLMGHTGKCLLMRHTGLDDAD